MNRFMLLVIVLSFSVFSSHAWAKDGLYLGMDLGVAVAPDMDVQTGGLDDWADPTTGVSASRCDQTINPDGVQVPAGLCGDGTPQLWGPMDESFDGGSGILAGLSVGYRLGNFRAEGEYFYRNANSDSTAVPSQGDWRPTQENGYDHVQDAVDDVLSHNFFANLYYDYRSDSKFTPYLGIGIGLAKVSVEYRTFWQRSTSPDNITVFDTTGPEGAAGRALNEKLAGALTFDRAKMSDTLFGYQALVGVDYQVSEPLTIGLKFRYADFGEFEDESEYTKLRGHASVAGNPPRPVTYYIRTDDIQFWGVSLNMKYQFE